MNQVTTQKNETGLSYKNVSIAQTGGGGMLLPQTFGEVVAFATMMARSQHAIPKHLRENDGACMAVTMQALRWEMDPFMVASKSYNVKDLIAYEAQLVAAVVNTRAPIAKRPVYRYEGEGDTRKCIVSCEMLDGSVKEYESPEIGRITTKNSPLWKADPDQQLGYFSIRSWARRHTPEVILGVYTPDEAEQFHGPDNARDITPQPSVMQRLRQNATQQPEGAREGFDSSFVHSETEGALTGEILDRTQSQSGAPHSPDADEPPHPSSAEIGESPSSSISSIPDTTEPRGGPVSETEAAGDNPPQTPPAASRDPGTETLIQFARDVLPMAADREATGAALKAIENEWAPRIKELSSDGQAKATSISKSMRAIFNGNTSLESAIDYYADVLGCSVEELGGRANG